MAYRHRPLGRTRLVRAIGLVELGDDLQVVEAAQILRHRIIEPQLALFEQHHDGHRRHRLRHRRNVEDGIDRHGHIAPDSSLPARLVNHGISIDDERHDAGGVTTLDRRGELARQLLGVERNRRLRLECGGRCLRETPIAIDSERPRVMERNLTVHLTFQPTIVGDPLRPLRGYGAAGSALRRWAASARQREQSVSRSAGIPYVVSGFSRTDVP